MIRLLNRLLSLLSLAVLAGCVEVLTLDRPGTVNVVVVDGTLTNLPEPQVIRLNRSRADPLTGRFGTLPLRGAVMAVLVDNTEIVPFKETLPGQYEGPADFRPALGRRYQLQFTLAGGERYVSDAEVMTTAPPVQAVRARFNMESLPKFRFDGVPSAVVAAHDFRLDFQDPTDGRNFYRWDWRLYEQQPWCATCDDALYAVNNIVASTGRGYFISGDKSFDQCFAQRDFNAGYGGESTSWQFDYRCRTRCWQIIQSRSLNLFSDELSNGGQVTDRLVAQIPFYHKQGALVEIRQVALTAGAFRYFSLVRDQTQNTGGVADAPPSIPVGNVRNVATPAEPVIGYFTATGVATVRYWLDRKDAVGFAPGCFRRLMVGTL